MNEPRMQPGWTRATMAALLTTVVAGGATCNVISGADSVEFTGEPTSSSGGGVGGGGVGGGGSGGGGSGGSSASGGGVDGGGVGGSGEGGASNDIECGHGVNDSFDMQCNPGDVVIGVFAYSVAWIDRFGLVCAPLMYGVPDPGHGYSSCWAGGEKTTHDEKLCPPEQAVVKLELHADSNTTIVHQLKIWCQTAFSWKQQSPNFDFDSAIFGGFTEGPFVYESSCPWGQVAYGYSGYSDIYLQSVSAPLCLTP